MLASPLRRGPIVEWMREKTTVENPSSGLRIAVTGANGFIGRSVVDRIRRGVLGNVTDLRLNDIQRFDIPKAKIFVGSFADKDISTGLIGEGVDILFHLASLPGGASEHDPLKGKRVNLEGSIALFDKATEQTCPVIVYTSSIAALGRGDQIVTQATALRPAGCYGTHKAMVELYLADLTRRKRVDGRSVRPAGIVARPRFAYSGFATAWMSDLFHAATENRPIIIPVPPDAQVWLQSIDVVADNIIHAARMPGADLQSHRVWTLPATVVRIETLVKALERWTGRQLEVEYGNSAMDQPLLDASDALALGFMSDGDTDALVQAVMRGLVSGSPIL